MAGTFHPAWGAWAATQKSASDWTADDLATTATETSDAIPMDELLSMEISIKIVYHADATEACIVYVLRDTDGTNYEDPALDSPWRFTMPINVASPYTNYKTFTVFGDEVSSFKVAVNNPDAETAAITVKQRSANGEYT